MSFIVVFAEDPNDGEALRSLLLWLCPTARASQIRYIRNPPTLQRGATGPRLLEFAERVRSAIRALPATPVCILVHTDCDDLDPTGGYVERRARELREVGLVEAHVVMPTEEIEAWWLLHPEATEMVAERWRNVLPRTKRDQDRVRNPKGELKRLTRRSGREYQVGDSRRIAETLRSNPSTRAQVGSSASFSRFRQTARECCRRL